MMADYIQIPALFQKIVNDLNTRLSTTYNFLYGPVHEIVSTLKDMSLNAEQCAGKYPLIALLTDIEERRDNPGFYAEINANLIIATITEQSYVASQRYSQILIPLLMPIYSELLSQIIISRYFMAEDTSLVPHTKVDRLNWGHSQLFSDDQGGVDFIDAIEIKNLNLKIKNLNCKQQWPIYI